VFKAPVFLCVLSGVIGLPFALRADVGGPDSRMAESGSRNAGYGFDTGTPPAVYAGQLAGAELGAAQGSWMRVRGLVEPALVKAGDARTVETDRDGLRALRARGIKTAVFLRWGPESWAEGVRAGGGQRLPLDLREAYERGRRLGETYGDLVDAWEVENEPDIGFVADNPETYAAFQKAVYLGLKHGAAAAFQSEAESLELRAKSQELGIKRPELTAHRSQLVAHCSPLVLMAPLALPPGPYLERLWANGIASYTDGFNFHYYGYAEDFSGVYRQFHDAVGELGSKSFEPTANSSDWVGRKRGLKLKADSSKLIARKPLPVFITEYGYGLLDAEARDTVEGRVRQWRWFASVIAQVHALRPEGPMAFYVNPYYEANLNEFGLTADKPMRLVEGEERGAKGEGIGDKSLELRAKSSESGTRSSGQTAHGSQLAAQLSFTPEDFGAKGAEPWMERIGHGLGPNHASPALAYLWDYAERNPYRARDWSVTTEPASPVVIDLVAGLGMEQIKSAGGYVVSSHVEVANYVISGNVNWVLYNFSPKAITGRLEISGEDGVASRVGACTVTVEAGGRVEIADDLGVQAKVFTGRTVRASFTPENAGVARAVCATRLFPTSEWMVNKPVADFDFTEGAAGRNRALLAKATQAEGEPVLRADGRWRVTEGVRVEERDGVWRFHIDYLPAEAMTSAVAELPLPEGFVFRAGMTLSLERRKVAAPVQARGDGREASGGQDGSGTAGIPKAAQLRSRAGVAGDMLSVSFRTKNGNLYQTWPRLRVGDEWAEYTEQADNFTMGFFGRAALPWRFFENRPAALVFSLRPSKVPAVFEVHGARIERVERAEVGR
jgi:hypothetical protein